MIHEMETDQCRTHHHSHISWSAIVAGALVGLGLGFLLHLFGSAIGLSAYSSSSSGAQVIAIGGLLGFLIGVIVSMLAAGYVAGYLSRFHQCVCHGGIIYGFSTWSLSLVLSALLVFPLMKYSLAYNYSLAHNVVAKATNDSQMNAPIINKAKKIITNLDTAPVTADNLAWSAWIVFILFFIGALSSCIGACWGMCCSRAKCIEPVKMPSRKTKE